MLYEQPNANLLQVWPIDSSPKLAGYFGHECPLRELRTESAVIRLWVGARYPRQEANFW